MSAFDHRRKRTSTTRTVPSSRVVGGHALVWTHRAADVIETPLPWWQRVIAWLGRVAS